MNRKIRIGMVGGGFMGQLAHLDNYARLPDVEIAALAEGRPEQAKRVAARYGIPRVYPDHRRMLDGCARELDAVVAIMGYSLHHAVVPDVLKAGKHLITEKPICVRAETGEELASLARRNGLTYQIGYMKRFDPGTRAAKAQLDAWRASGQAGALRYARMTAAMTDWTWGIERPLNSGEPYPEYEDEKPEPVPGWMNEAQGKRYHEFVNFWIHQVNLMRHLLGEAYALEYVAPGGLLAVARSASGAPVTFELHTNRIKNQWEERFTFCFEKAQLDLNLHAPLHRQAPGEVRILTEGESGPQEARPFTGTGWAFAEQARLFVASLRGEAPALSPADEAVADLHIAEQYIKLLKA
ncbi:MAG: Gfo/Idh/MocA family oxidoreductase [Planctomycetota bacterium]|nr:Gfo/Idh/MocA family oxidoreductase [Planctomycetota bacterium]